MLVIGFLAVLAYPTNMSWWSFLLAVFISFLFALPIGIIQAVTNNQIGLNVLTEFVYGYIQPGRPLALMMYVLLLQCLPVLYHDPRPNSVPASKHSAT
jgi:membrane protease YdiL (CAAX protease family)